VDVETARTTIATERPRRLRLAELLRELGARDEDSPPPTPAASPAAPAPIAPARPPPDARPAPTPVDPAGLAPAPVDPACTAPAPVDPACTAPAPVDPACTAPAPVDPARPPPDARPAPAVRPAPDASAAAAAPRVPDAAKLRSEVITVGALVDRAEEGGFGFLIGVLALIAIPFFGLSTPFGLAIALLGAQLMLGRRHPWLPARARRRALSMAMLDRVLRLLSRRTRWLARLSRRRWELAIRPPVIGFAIVLLALGLALPLPIPGSNLIFLIPVLIFAIGVLERDGLWIAVGYACTLVDLGLLIAFGATVLAVVERAWHWLL
jgi:hypothetical protein